MLDNPSTEGLTLVTAKLKNGVPIMNQGLQNNYNRLTIEFGRIEATKSIIKKDGLWCNYCKMLRHTKKCSKLHSKP